MRAVQAEFRSLVACVLLDGLVLLYGRVGMRVLGERVWGVEGYERDGRDELGNRTLADLSAGVLG